MANLSSMGGFRSPEGTEAKKRAIQAAIAAISADIKDGIISEAGAFDILCSELAIITGLPVETRRLTTVH